MPATLVRKSWSTSIWPRLLTARPALSRSSPSVLGRRPIETRTTSASIVSAAPPAAGSTVSVTPSCPCALAPVTLVEVRISKPCFLKILRAFLADLAVHAGQDLVEKLDDGDLGAEPPPDRAELEPDHAAADHHHRAPAPWSSSSALVESTIRLMVDLDAGQRGDAGAGGDDEILRLVALAGDVDRVLGGELGMALQPFDLVLLEQEFDAAGQPLDRLQPRCRASRRGRARARRSSPPIWRARPNAPPRTARRRGAAPWTGCSRR